MKENNLIDEFLESIINDKDDLDIIITILQEDKDNALKLLLEKIDA